MGGVLALEPPDLVDLGLDVERLERVEARRVRLERAVDVVLAARRLVRLRLRIALEDDHAAALVARRQQLAVVVELHARDDVLCGAGGGGSTAGHCLKPGPHRTRQRCSGPICDRPSAFWPVSSRQNRHQGAWAGTALTGAVRTGLQMGSQ